MQSSTARWVAPQGRAVIEQTGEGVRVRRLDGTIIDANGAFADEILAFIDSGSTGPRLAVMADVEPFKGGLRGLCGVGRSALTPTRALELAGWDLLFIEVVGKCNERCVHCYADSAPEVDTALSRDQVLAILDDAKKIGFPRVQFTGGDPLLCSFLPEVVERAHALGLFPEIYTNGLLLSEKLLERLAPFISTIAFSYYSLRPEVHDAITRTANSHALTTRAIQRSLARGVSVRASVIIMDENVEDAAATVAHLRSMGVKQIDLAPGRAVGRGKSFHGQLDPALWEVGMSAHGGVSKEDSRAELGKLAVASDGSVYPCIFNRATPLGHIAQRRLADVVAAPDVRRSLMQDPNEDREKLQCAGCRLTAVALRDCARGVR